MAKKRRGDELAAFVRKVVDEKGLTLRQVEAQSRRGGSQGITHGYLSKIISGSAVNLTVDKLKAIARGLGIPEDQLFSVARGMQLESELGFKESDFAVLFFKYNELAPEDQAELKGLIQLVDREIDRKLGGDDYSGPTS